jgi:hypothetical protein
MGALVTVLIQNMPGIIDLARQLFAPPSRSPRTRKSSPPISRRWRPVWRRTKSGLMLTRLVGMATKARLRAALELG